MNRNLWTEKEVATLTALIKQFGRGKGCVEAAKTLGRTELACSLKYQNLNFEKKEDKNILPKVNFTSNTVEIAYKTVSIDATKGVLVFTI